jgi:hypothetical protein
MHDQNVPIGAIEPGEDEDLGPDLKVAKTSSDIRAEGQPCFRSPFVALLRSGGAVDER